MQAHDGLMALDKFRQGLQLLKEADETKFQVSVDKRIIHDPVVDPDTEVESEPLFNCLLSTGDVINIRLSAFCVGKHAEVENGVFTLQDDDGITHQIRFYRLAKLWFR